MFDDTLRQLRKLSIYKPMNFQVKSINLDFEDDNFELSPIEQIKILNEVKSHTWQAVDGDDLVEEITSATGFCVNSIDYIPSFPVPSVYTDTPLAEEYYGG